MLESLFKFSSNTLSINEYFDNVYLLNLHKRPQRLNISKKRLDFVDIKYNLFGATDGSVMYHLWGCLQNPNFKNPNYLGCAISHLSMYKDAIEKGYEKILIIEDDCRVNRNIEFNFCHSDIPDKYDLLYFGFIPLSDDCSRWDYNVFELRSDTSLVKAKNFWGLYAYSISRELMIETIERYNKDFPMELDRYFVTEIQPRGNSYGYAPQPFCAEDGPSDNSGISETGMMQRSIDTRFAKLTDYI